MKNGQKHEEKTNAVRLLEQKKAAFRLHNYGGEAISGTEVAAVLGEDPDDVFKTLVTVGKSGAHYVFVVPVNRELDLKKAARTVGEKSVDMVKSRELLPLTGYIHGGCSPVGMKKFLRTVVHTSAAERDRIFVSGGKIGMQIETTLDELKKAVRLELADLCK